MHEGLKQSLIARSELISIAYGRDGSVELHLTVKFADGESTLAEQAARYLSRRDTTSDSETVREFAPDEAY